MKNWKNGKIIYCPEKYCIIVHLEHSFFFSGLALLAFSSQLDHAVTFPPFCFVLADKMNGVLYRVVSVRNCCLLLISDFLSHSIRRPVLLFLPCFLKVCESLLLAIKFIIENENDSSL